MNHWHIFQPRMRDISIFVLFYYGIGLSIAVSQMNFEFMFYGAIMGAIMAIIVLMDKRIAFTRTVLWMMALWGLVHLAGGIMPIPEAITEPDHPANLYNMRLLPWLPKMDQIVHALGFATTTLIAYESLCAHYHKTLRISWAVGSQLFFIATGLGALNEVIEFIAVLLMPHTNVGGYVNTGWDLVSNSVGSLLMIAWIEWRRVRDSNP